jgi:hypothetical protein
MDGSNLTIERTSQSQVTWTLQFQDNIY